MSYNLLPILQLMLPINVKFHIILQIKMMNVSLNVLIDKIVNL